MHYSCLLSVMVIVPFEGYEPKVLFFFHADIV